MVSLYCCWKMLIVVKRFWVSRLLAYERRGELFVFFNGGSVNTLQNRGLGIVSMFLDMGDCSLFSQYLLLFGSNTFPCRKIIFQTSVKIVLISGAAHSSKRIFHLRER